VPLGKVLCAFPHLRAVLCRLCIPNLKVWNPKLTKAQNSLSYDMIL
jgi:hypothetical protein